MNPLAVAKLILTVRKPVQHRIVVFRDMSGTALQAETQRGAVVVICSPCLHPIVDGGVDDSFRCGRS